MKALKIILIALAVIILFIFVLGCCKAAKSDDVWWEIEHSNDPPEPLNTKDFWEEYSND